MAPEAAPLGANNGACRITLMKMLCLSLPKSITSDNHLTGAVHTGHVIPASTCSGSLLSMILVTLPITDIYHRVDSFPSLYISLLTLATCRNYSPMKAALLQSSCSVASHMWCMLSSARHRKNPLMIATYPHIWFDVLCVDSRGDCANHIQIHLAAHSCIYN